MAEKNVTVINQNEISEKDINDVFESIAFSEEQICNESFQEGLIKGEKDGKFEGYHLGFHKGLELGSEIGFYKGLTKVLINNEDLKKNQKIQPLLEKLMHLLGNFSEHNCHDVNMAKNINDVRAHFKKLNSLLKLNIVFPITPVISF